MPGQIKKLSENVINKIAAGEVIKDPAAIVKEMVENSIDAKSTAITVHIRRGGLDLIEISDNGSGIDRDDFELLCERFATSKIASADDLRSVSSFGFRGEALASVSYVANLSVISKTRASDIAYNAQFFEGKLHSNTGEDPSPKPIQGHDGTIMTVEDLFLNIPSRKAGLSASEEYTKILKLLMKFAIHYHMISFTLKKDAKVEMSTTNIQRKDRSDFDIRKDLISRFYSSHVGQNLLFHNLDMSDYKCTMEISLTKPDKKIKGKNLVLFINDRLVECDSLRKSMQLAYSESVFGIHDLGADFFAYVNMKIKSEYIDVNVNPTKKEVHFLNERIIADQLKSDIEGIIKEHMNIKTFKAPILRQITFDTDVPATEQTQTQTQSSMFKIQKNMVRTDPKAQRLDQFFQQSEEKFSGMKITEFVPVGKEEKKEENYIANKMTQMKVVDEKSGLIQGILDKYAKNSDKETTKFIQSLVFVGSISKNYICCQYEQQLIMINTIPLCEEAFYLICLKEFGNFATRELLEPIPLEDAIHNALAEGEIDDGSVLDDKSTNKFTKKCITKLEQIRQTLEENLSIYIRDGFIVGVPEILDSVSVKEEDIGNLLVRLCTEVNFQDKEEMIMTMCKELSFYLAWSLEDRKNDNFDAQLKSDCDKVFNGKLFPMLKTEFSFKKIEKSEVYVKLLQLQDIYKIFERC